MNQKQLPPMSIRKTRGIIEFLRDWLAWAEADAPEQLAPSGANYSPQAGLCGNASIYKLAYGDPALPYFELMSALNILLSASVNSRELNNPMPTPFGGLGEYNRRSAFGTQHRCPERLRWVRETVAALEDQLKELK